MSIENNPNLARLRLVLESDFSSLEELIDKTETFLRKNLSDLDDDFMYRLLLLASEAVTNAIEHGNRKDPQKKVTYDLYIQKNVVECCVEDEGRGFKREAVDNPLLDENLMRDGGRGLFLLETMADAIHYEKGGRKIRMLCKINNEYS